MRYLIKFIYLLLLITVVNTSVLAGKIAVTTKIKGKVELQQKSSQNYKDLKPGTLLGDGDRIRTGSLGFAAIIFIDDKTTLKIKEKSELVITGKRSAVSIAKKIDLDGGTVRAMVSKQRKGDFIIPTTTSVASVKGTDFWLVSDPSNGDEVMGLEGIVNLLNIETGLNVDVTEGNTGVSTPDGQVNMTETNPTNIPDDPDGNESGESQIRIYFEGPNGEQKSLLIKYQ